jgi:hypothetical protein
VPDHSVNRGLRLCSKESWLLPGDSDRSIQWTARRILTLSADRTLMRMNVEKISTKSVSLDEINQQRAVLDGAERKLTRMGQGIEKIREKIAMLRQQVADARSLDRERDTAQTRRALLSVTSKLDGALQLRDTMLSQFREIKLIVRDQRAVCRNLEKKEEAKQKAVARFLKEWERRYDREARMKEKNVQQRKRLTRT